MLNLTLAAALLLTAAAPDPSDRIDAAVRAGIASTGAKGLAVACFENGKLLFQRSYGARDAAGDPLDTDTII